IARRQHRIVRRLDHGHVEELALDDLLFRCSALDIAAGDFITGRFLVTGQEMLKRGADAARRDQGELNGHDFLPKAFRPRRQEPRAAGWYDSLKRITAPGPIRAAHSPARAPA